MQRNEGVGQQGRGGRQEGATITRGVWRREREGGGGLPFDGSSAGSRLLHLSHLSGHGQHEEACTSPHVPSLVYKCLSFALVLLATAARSSPTPCMALKWTTCRWAAEKGDICFLDIRQASFTVTFPPSSPSQRHPPSACPLPLLAHTSNNAQHVT
jgi:hypothetical protein